MGYTLRTVLFSAEFLEAVSNFDCGTDHWAMMASDWIKQSPPFRGALLSMQKRGTSVWLHFLDICGDDYLVGFSSLGTVRWRLPSEGDSEKEASYIPMLAVSKQFQGLSPYITVETASSTAVVCGGKDTIERKTNISCLIMDHLFLEAKRRGR